MPTTMRRCRYAVEFVQRRRPSSVDAAAVDIFEPPDARAATSFDARMSSAACKMRERFERQQD